LGSRGFVCVLVGRRLLSSKEVMHSVVSFKPLGMESWSRTTGAFLGHKGGMRSKVAAHETIFKLNGYGLKAKE